MSNPTLVVMAAGMGSRYGGFKQLDPVGPNGEIILDYSVYDAIQAGFDKVVFIIRREIEDAFRERIGRALENRVDVAYVAQELTNLPDGYAVPGDRTKPWGTAHAVLSSKSAVTAPFAVINADDYYGATAFSEPGRASSSGRGSKWILRLLHGWLRAPQYSLGERQSSARYMRCDPGGLSH